MATINAGGSSIPAPPRPLFSGFPYFVTRLAPANYHFILLPAEKSLGELQELARCQAALNALPSCLVLDERHCFYLENGRQDGPSEKPPRGGLVYSRGLRCVTPIPHTPELTHRYRLFDRFAKDLSPSGRIVFGDLTKGGRDATPAELAKLAGQKRDGVPRGLRRCRKCGDWGGRCLDPSPDFSGKVMQVHCLCDNGNLCAACLKPLHGRKLNANYFDPSDGMVWHVPGFFALAHNCNGDGRTIQKCVA